MLIFDMMRVSSSATIGTQGVCFCSAVFEKLARKVDTSLTSWGEKHYIYDHFKPAYGCLRRSVLLFQIWELVGSLPIYYIIVAWCSEMLVFSSETSVGAGQLWHLVRYLYDGISPCRVNRFLICLLIWTQLEQYVKPCKWRFVSFSRFWEIALDTYGQFVILVTGTFRVSTCEMLKLMIWSARIGSLNSICNGESPPIYFV